MRYCSVSDERSMLGTIGSSDLRFICAYLGDEDAGLPALLFENLLLSRRAKETMRRSRRPFSSSLASMSDNDAKSSTPRK